MEPRGSKVELAGASKPAIVHKNGMVIFGNDGKMVRNIRKFKFIFVKTILDRKSNVPHMNADDAFSCEFY